MKQKILILALLMNFPVIQISSQGSKLTREEYISKYKDLSIKEMARTGIPASITMAQGLLESGNGNSRLALKANNHFGIKCHDWEGRKLRHDDDARKECFRKYKTVEESYRDHSDFLTTKSRYASLFQLDPTDYKQWAIGLKNAGYATSPTYAEALIRIIEENNLYLLDQGVDVDLDEIQYAHQVKQNSSTGHAGAQRQVFENNRVKYIIAKEGDTFASLTAEFELLPWQLPKYNETSENQALFAGQVLYIQPKRANSEAGKKAHVVTSGETMYSISQKYAVKLDKLYVRNQMKKGTEPEIGKELILRGSIKGRKIQSPPVIKDESENEGEMKFEFDME
jgi:LysM repeat protein